MAHEHSAEDLVVARILRMLPHLMWEAQHTRPCTHNLLWGARKRRSAGSDEAQPPPTHSLAAALLPPSPRPRRHLAAPSHALEKPNKKRCGHHTKSCPAVDTSEEKATAVATVCGGRGLDPAVPETASRESQLEFCHSSEEPDAKAKPRPHREGQPHTKRPKSNLREQLAKRIDLLVHTRTELRKEAAEARNRPEGERWRYSELVELRVKLEESRYYHQQQLQQKQLVYGRSCYDLPQTCAVGSTPDHVHRHKQPYQAQHLWPKQWANIYPVVRPSSTAPAAGRPHCAWMASQPLGLAGSPDGSCPSKIPDLNARAEDDLAWS